MRCEGAVWWSGCGWRCKGEAETLLCSFNVVLMVIYDADLFVLSRIIFICFLETHIQVGAMNALDCIENQMIQNFHKSPCPIICRMNEIVISSFRQSCVRCLTFLDVNESCY